MVGLTISAFIFNTTEFAPISLLTDIASDFNIRQSMLTAYVYAWVVASLLAVNAPHQRYGATPFTAAVICSVYCKPSSLRYRMELLDLMISRIGIAFFTRHLLVDYRFTNVSFSARGQKRPAPLVS